MITTTLFPRRYIQGRGALDRLPDEVAAFGKKGFFLADANFIEVFKDRYKPKIEKTLQVQLEKFGGACTDDEVERLVKLAKGCDFVVGMGGGRTLDAARVVAHRLQVCQIVVPTIASTDAPCSSVAPIRSPDGRIKEVVNTRKGPDVVVVDTQVIAESPVRYLVAGMGDALSTWFEAESCKVNYAKSGITGDYTSMTAHTLARLCFDTLMQYGVAARQACVAKVVTPALEHVVEANSLLSAVGFESGGLAAAHALENGLAILKEAEELLHGELVAFGVLVSLILTDKPADLIDEVYCFCEAVGLPTTLADLGLGSTSQQKLMAVAEEASKVGFMANEATPVDKEAVFAAIVTADAEGKRRKGK